jgi:hypothetical protein
MKKNLKILVALFFSSSLALTTGWGAPSSKIKGRRATNAAFSVGEELKFKMGWKAATAGYATLTVQGIVPRQNRRAYRLICDVQSNKAIDAVFQVRDQLESWMDTETLASLGFVKRVDEGGYKTDEIFFIDSSAGRYRARRVRLDKKSTPQQTEGTVPPFIQDLVSAFYYLRTQPLTVGKSIPMDVMGGAQIHRVQASVLKKESIEVPAGKFSCLVLEPLFQTDQGLKPHPKASIYVWVTDDARHLPVKIGAKLAFGEINAELAGVKAGQTAPPK